MVASRKPRRASDTDCEVDPLTLLLPVRAGRSLRWASEKKNVFRAEALRNEQALAIFCGQGFTFVRSRVVPRGEDLIRESSPVPEIS